MIMFRSDSKALSVCAVHTDYKFDVKKDHRFCILCSVKIKSILDFLKIP